jgi:hypothetical protein
MGVPFGASNMGLVPLERFWGASSAISELPDNRYAKQPLFVSIAAFFMIV